MIPDALRGLYALRKKDCQCRGTEGLGRRQTEKTTETTGGDDPTLQAPPTIGELRL